MTEQSQRYNLRTLRELLQTAFSVEELRDLFSFPVHLDLRPVADQFSPEDSKPAMVRKAVLYCQSRYLLDKLVAEIKEANPRAYAQFEPGLLIPAVEHTQEEETPEPTPEILTIISPIYLDLVRIPAGEFLMGSVAARDKDAEDFELPPHRVYVPEFHIGKYPVINLQYQAFVKATQRPAPKSWREDGIPPDLENRPVSDASLEDALAFCAWLSEETARPFRLPTEAEWEKAARGTDGRIYPWGDEPPDEGRCNYFGNKVGDTTSIGRYSPQGDSPYSCADMAGNVWEWCQSVYRPYPYRAGDGREDPQTPGPRVLRGGSFYDLQWGVRCAFRFGDFPNIRDDNLGFRVVMAPAPSDLRSAAL